VDRGELQGLTGNMENSRLIHDFERNANAGAPFHHGDHVRLAFAYLCEYPVLQAIERFSAALKQFAAGRGKPQLFHETITCAYLFLIHERMAQGETRNWEDFARRNPDLLGSKDAVLRNYYSDAVLQSDLARKVFVLPHKCLAPASHVLTSRDR
jgi:hypothetical protein